MTVHARDGHTPLYAGGHRIPATKLHSRPNLET